MAERQATCAECGAELDSSSQFCGACGTRIVRPQPAVAESKPDDAKSASEAGGTPVDAKKPAPPAEAATDEPTKQPNLARTMLGVNASQLFGMKPGAPQSAAATPARGTPNGLFSSAQNPPAGSPPRPLRAPTAETAVTQELTRPAPGSGVTPVGPGGAAVSEPKPAATADGLTAAGRSGGSSTDAATAAKDGPTARSVKPAVGAETVAGGTLAPASSRPAGPAAPKATAQSAPPAADPAGSGASKSSSPGAVPAPSNPPLLFSSLAPPSPAAAPQSPKLTAPFPAIKSNLPPPDDSQAGSSAQAVAAERPRRSPAKTMLGISPEAALGLQRMAAEQSGSAARSEPPAAPPASGSEPPAAKPAGNPMARTMLGMANPLPGPQPMAAGGLPGMNKNTIQGVALPSAAPPADASGKQSDRGAMARTMLGMAPLGANAGTPAAGGGAGSGPNAQGLGGRTMLGQPPSAPGSAATPSSGPPRSMAATAAEVISSRTRTEEDASVRETARIGQPRREIRALWPLVAATLVVVIATLVLLLRAPQDPQVDVSAKIVSSETGEALLFEVPSAPDGSKIRFGGQEKPLTAGRASFALAADSLRVGDNLVLAEVVRPDAEPAPVRITLAVYYRIWVDTAALRAERPALDVVVTALPGTSVTLDGEELKLDQAGRGTRSYPIDVVSEAKSGVIEHVVRYRVQPPSGETVVDELRTRIPVAMMQIDRPGREVLTDRDSIEIAGAVGKDTQVQLDKTVIPVKDGRFLHRMMLPQPGDYKPRLVATSPGKAPFGVTLAIKRVKDLGQAAAQFTPVPDLSYAKLAPNPAIYRGQKIALEGRVYAVDPRGADSVIQMFVRPCPSSRRCPLWVSDPHATEVNVDAWVRVLGIVQGEQQFRSEKNEIVTVPKVEAQFVLPAAP